MKISRNHIPKLSKFLTISWIAILAIFTSNKAFSAVQLSVDGALSDAYTITSRSSNGFGFTVDNQDYIFTGAAAFLQSSLSLEQANAIPVLFSLYAADSAGLPTGASLVNLTSDPITKASGTGYRFLTPTSAFTLQANHTYVLVATSSVVWFDYYAWTYTREAQYGPQGTLWAPLPGSSRSYDGGLTWTMIPGELLVTMIYATPVPEPSSIILLTGVGAATIWMKRRARRN